MAKKVLDYKVIWDTRSEGLGAQVLSYLNRGYELAGGCSMAADKDDLYFGQAVVKYG